ncbi:MAG: hypothetical protein OSA37_02615 [Flavobacteriales bacterium]|nr:hypothetical protein [Flavobacteriales bacterium]
MSSSLNPSIDRARQAEHIAQAEVRVFRADQYPDRCHALVDGHQAVLSAYGIQKLATFNRDWIGNPRVLVVAAIGHGNGVDGKSERILGGARMHLARTVDELPLMEAIGSQDSNLSQFMQPYVEEGAYELGGMWNSIEMAGMGVEATLLIKAAMATLTMVSGRHLFALTSPVTRRMQAPLGFLTETGVGDDGYFTYPTQKLRATIARYTFPEQLEQARPEVRDLLEGIWQDPEGMIHRVQGPKGELKLQFKIEV